MGIRRAFLGFILIGMLAGSLYSVQNATISNSANLARWTPSSVSASSITTEGGNISNVNLSGIIRLTERWAAFYGNISSSTIVLRDASAIVYSWSYNTSVSSGRVCVSNSSTFPTGTMVAAVPADVNSLWALGSAVDNATNTLTVNGTNMISLSNTSVNCSAPCAVKDLSNFTTVAVYNGTNTNANNYAFCTMTNSTGKNFRGENYVYELMVPTLSSLPEVAGPVVSYYFYIELD